MIDRATPAQQRKSTLLVAGVFAAIAGYQLYRGRPLAAQLTGGLAGLLFLVAFVPPAARAFFRMWMALAGVLGYFSTRILLTVFFYLVMTPFGAVMSWTGHQRMSRRPKGRLATYWHRREHTRQTREGFERGF